MTASEGLLYYFLAAPRIDSATLHRYLQTLARSTLAATPILPSRRQCEVGSRLADHWRDGRQLLLKSNSRRFCALDRTSEDAAAL